MADLFKLDRPDEKPKILVVDDEPDMLTALKYRLEWSNCLVCTAGDGELGLEKAFTEKPDLILLDAKMPFMNGHEMLRQLKKTPTLRHIPVIMLTGMCDEEDMERASANGACDYVTKPFNFTELTDKIANALGCQPVP